MIVPQLLLWNRGVVRVPNGKEIVADVSSRWLRGMRRSGRTGLAAQLILALALCSVARDPGSQEVYVALAEGKVTVDRTAAVAALAVHLDDLDADGRFSGVVLVARGHDVLFSRAYGLADRAKGVTNRVDTLFNLGSLGKMFTAVAILQLVEEGRLSIESLIADVLPDYPNASVAQTVSIHHLLTHTAGMGDCFSGEFFTTPSEQLKTVDGYLPLFVHKRLRFVPGGQFAYSNEGYIVLGLIIERVSGQAYDEYIREHIFEPAGMVRSEFADLDVVPPNLAIGYTTLDADGAETGVVRENTSLMPVRGTPAGGAYSTALDLLHFVPALLDHRLLSPESTALLLRGKVELRPGLSYAYGLFDKIVEGERVIGHTGGAPGVCNLLDANLDSGYSVIVLSNSDAGCLSVLSGYLADSPLP